MLNNEEVFQKQGELATVRVSDGGRNRDRLYWQEWVITKCLLKCTQQAESIWWMHISAQTRTANTDPQNSSTLVHTPEKYMDWENKNTSDHIPAKVESQYLLYQTM